MVGDEQEAMRRRNAAPVAAPDRGQDTTIATLTAKADLVLVELVSVIETMAAMLREGSTR